MWHPITYSGTKDVIIRTNNYLYANLIIDTQSGSVRHYGIMKFATVKINEVNEYHEYGALNSVEVKKGKVVVESTTSLGNVIVKGDGVKIDSKKTSNLGVTIWNIVKILPEVTVNGIKDDSKIVYTYSVGEGDGFLNESQKLVLNRDVSKGFTIDGNTYGTDEITVDLNGHTINGYLAIINGAKVKLVGNGGSIVSTDYAIKLSNGSTVTIDDVTVKSKYACVSIEPVTSTKGNNNITINSGTFTSDDQYVVGTHGKEGLGGNTITINGGVFNGNTESSGDIACGIYAANSDTWNINAGIFNIKNGCGMVIRGGNVTIGNSVSINLTNGADASGKVGDSNVQVKCAEIVVDKQSKYPDYQNITVTNGTSYKLYGPEGDEVDNKGDKVEPQG